MLSRRERDQVKGNVASVPRRLKNDEVQKKALQIVMHIQLRCLEKKYSSILGAHAPWRILNQVGCGSCLQKFTAQEEETPINFAKNEKQQTQD